MAASPATSSAAARASSFARLSNAPLRAPRAAAVSFPSPNSARPTALVADARASRYPVVAAAAAGHQRLMGSLTNTEGLRFAVVVARFNEIVTNLLLQGALEAFERYSIKAENITGKAAYNRPKVVGPFPGPCASGSYMHRAALFSVPGSFEIPVAAQKLGKSGKYDAILCIGAVIRGDTTHYDAVANSAASGVLNAGLSAGVPCVFGVLTCDDMDQALNRAGGKAGNKGAETAITAIEMASLFRHHLG